MSKDNELWRQFCLERWQNIPRESDCAKNWLIPVREGGTNILIEFQILGLIKLISWQ
jgi:hypothetical protein